MSIFVLAVLFVGAAWPRAVAAADPDDLIRQGVELRRRRDDAGALKLFDQAYQIDKKPRALAQMGLAEQALGRWVAAADHIRQALDVPSDPWIAKNALILNQSLDRVSEHVGFIEILDGPAGAEVRLDGVRRGNLPLARPLATTIGTVAIELVAPGYLPIQRNTSTRARETTRESFDGVGRQVSKSAPERSVPIATAPPAEVKKEPSVAVDAPNSDPITPRDSSDSGPGAGRSRPWVLLAATGGIAAGALVLGVVEHLAWQKKVASFAAIPGCGADESGRGGPACDQIYSAGHRAEILALVGYGVAAALATTTAVIFFNTAPTDGGGSQQVACAVNPVARGMGCTIRF